MEKIVKSGLRDCTVTLDGTECAVKFDSCYRAFSVRNDSAADVYISKTSGIIPDNDGVMCVKAGGSAVFAHMDINADTVYLLGDGKVQIHAQNDTNCRFKLAPAANGGGVNYSTDEQLIGTWIDGKPLYQKTIVFDVNKTSEWIRTSIGSESYNVVGHESYVRLSGTDVNVPIPTYRTSSDFIQVCFGLNTMEIYNSATSNYGTCYSTIRYTKR